MVVYRELARGSMGEGIAARESLCNNRLAGTYFVIDGNLPTNDTVCFKSRSSNKLIYIHNAVLAITNQTLTPR